MVLFVVNTYSQFINAIVIAESYYKKDTECDVLFKKNLYDEHKELCENVFRRCIKWEDNSNKKEGLSKVLNVFKYKHLAHTLNINFKEYESIFISSKSIDLIEVFYAAKNINKNIELNLYEEGAFEYCELEERTRWLEVVLSYLIFHRYYLSECKKLFVYRPEFIISHWKNIEICKIENIYTSKILKKILNSFGKSYFFETLEEKSVIFFEQEGDEQLNCFQKDILNILKKLVPNKQVYVKMHPRSKDNKYGDKVLYIKSKVPFELDVYENDISNYVFVTICSSAALNISLLTDQKPNIVYLYNLYNFKDSINEYLNKFINRNIINDSNVFAPKNKDEFEKCIRRIYSDV